MSAPAVPQGSSDLHQRIQAAGKNMLIYVFSLMKTGEIHDLNNEAYNRPVEKLSEALDQLFRIERQGLTLVIYENIAQINTHALWLDPSSQEQAQELEQSLAKRESGGIAFLSKPGPDELKRFFYHFARFRPPPDEKNQMKALSAHLLQDGIAKMKLAPAPLRLEGVGVGVRGVASLWHYSKASAGVREILTRAPIDIKRARRVALELVDACGTEQDLLTALPLLGQAPHDIGRRAVDVGVLTAATARALGMTAVEVANVTVAALLHQAGNAFENPDPGTFTAPEAAGILAFRQLVDATRLTGDLARRVAVGVEFALGPDGAGPPYLAGAPPLIADSQVVALATTWLDLVRGTEKELALSPLEAALRLLKSPPRQIDRALVQVFLATVGLLPVGTLVELQNEDVGVVADIEHLRGRAVYNAPAPPVAAPRKVFVERMRTSKGALIPERQARVQLGSETPDGTDTWSVRRTLDPEGWTDVILRGLLRRPTTVATQMGLRA